jgi:hypothetical protein
MAFQNNPGIKSESGEWMKKEYTHQPLTIDHFGIQAQIKENGRILIKGRPTPVPGTDEVEYDEVEIPASLVFKLASALRLTRKEEMVVVHKKQE